MCMAILYDQIYFDLSLIVTVLCTYCIRYHFASKNHNYLEFFKAEVSEHLQSTIIDSTAINILQTNTNFWEVHKTMIIIEVLYQLLIASQQTTTQINSSKHLFLITIIQVYHLGRIQDVQLTSAPQLYCQADLAQGWRIQNDCTLTSATSVLLVQNGYVWLGQLGRFYLVLARLSHLY